MQTSGSPRYTDITSAMVTQMHKTPKQNMITRSPSFSCVGQQLSFAFLPVGARGMVSILPFQQVKHNTAMHKCTHRQLTNSLTLSTIARLGEGKTKMRPETKSKQVEQYKSCACQ